MYLIHIQITEHISLEQTMTYNPARAQNQRSRDSIFKTGALKHDNSKDDTILNIQ